MGDISEIRGMVLLITFIGVLILLMGLIPSGFLIADYEGRDVHVPEEFDSIDLESYASTWAYEMNETGVPFDLVLVSDIDIGSHICAFWYIDYDGSPKYVRWVHKTVDWLVIPTSHPMQWRHDGVTVSTNELPISQMETDYDVNENALEYTLWCTHFTAHIFFAFNETAYSSLTDAWENGKLNVFVGVTLDQVSTSYNAWALVSMLLFFQLPDVHFIINALFAIPIWVGIAYISYILMLRTIGAIFGGGA